jgi:YD repeat-containing protein
MSKKIKTEKVYHVPVRNDESKKADTSDGILRSLNEYDENGNLILEITYHADGSISEKNEYSYDDNGKLIGTTIYSEEGDALESRKIYRDDSGKAMKEEIVYMDGSVDTVSYTYHEGRLAQKMQETDEGEVENKEIFEYEGDKITLYEKYDEDDRLVYQVKNQYQEGALKKSEIWSSENGETFRKVVEFEDGENRRLELKYDEKDRLIERNQYESEDGGKVARVVEENPSKKNTTEFIYDDRGNLISQHEKDMHGQTVTLLERFYDDEGRLREAAIGFRDRMTGVMGQSRMMYDYEFYD